MSTERLTNEKWENLVDDFLSGMSSEELLNKWDIVRADLVTLRMRRNYFRKVWKPFKAAKWGDDNE